MEFVQMLFLEQILIMVLIERNSGLSLNKPKICSNATWNPVGMTFSSVLTNGRSPRGLFINQENEIYVADRTNHSIRIWINGSNTLSESIYANLNSPYALFVTENGDIFIENGAKGEIIKWKRNSKKIVRIMNVSSHCLCLFIDIVNNLNYIIEYTHQVFQISLNQTNVQSSIIAGNGSEGSLSHMLAYPHGIYVNLNLDLYITDSNNNRIQLFRKDQINGQTILSNHSLNYPTSITLDFNDYLYIVDNQNHRILKYDYNQMKCLVGCSDGDGSNANQLSLPRTISFDINANLFVADQFNDRIQKFLILNNICSQIQSTTITKSYQPSTKENPTTQSISSTTNISFNQSIGYFDQTTSKVDQWNFSTASSQIDQNCSFSDLQLIPNLSFLSEAKEYQRNENILIQSKLQVNCTLTNPIIYQWTINICQLKCFQSFEDQNKLNRTVTELFLPSQTFNYGFYQLKLTVSSQFLSLSSSTYIQIIASPLSISFLPFGTSLITIGEEQDLLLSPGKYSFLTHSQSFDQYEWTYSYQCRISSSNDQCFSNQWQSSGDSLNISAGSLKSNETYKFGVHMINRLNGEVQGRDELIVQVTKKSSPLILIGCVISLKCFSKDHWKYWNSGNQLILFSLCIDHCFVYEDIQWNLFYTSKDGLSWKQFHPIGGVGELNGNNLTIAPFFSTEITFWRFEVIYSNGWEKSRSAFDVLSNQCPRNGSCQIFPSNGSVNTLFNITCFNWFDEDQIKDYSFYVWSVDRNEEMIIGFTNDSQIEIRLPPADQKKESLIHLRAHIRDRFDCVTLFHFHPILLLSPNFSTTKIFLQTLEKEQKNLSRNENQLILSLSEQFDQFNEQIIHSARQKHSFLGNVSVSSFAIPYSFNSPIFFNQSIFKEYVEEFNDFNRIRENFLLKLRLNSIEDILIYSAILSTLTKSTNQLSEKTSILASHQCLQLSILLQSLSLNILSEDAFDASKHILQCTTNVLTSRNIPFQRQRNQPNENFDRIFNEYNQIISLITSLLNIHLNLGQIFQIQNKQIFFSLEKMSLQSLQNKTIHFPDHGLLFIPSNIQFLENPPFILVRSSMELIALYDQSNWNSYSRSISLSILDQNLQEISLTINDSIPIELLIPRDPNLFVPPMFLQNVTSLNMKEAFHYHFIHFNDNEQNMSQSIHFQIRPENVHLKYLFIYRFDQSSEIIGWKCFSSQNLSIDGIYQTFLDHRILFNHHSVLFGLRELNDEEEHFHPSTFSHPNNFTSNYSLRLYRSSCSYFNGHNSWKSDGLWVGPLTNLTHTHCFSNHLRKF